MSKLQIPMTKTFQLLIGCLAVILSLNTCIKQDKICQTMAFFLTKNVKNLGL